MPVVQGGLDDDARQDKNGLSSFIEIEKTSMKPLSPKAGMQAALAYDGARAMRRLSAKSRPTAKLISPPSLPRLRTSVTA
jgi:hypothetical protein